MSLLLLIPLAGAFSHAAERHALILSPHGTPVRLESATFFDDGRVLDAVWRNGTREVLYAQLRVFVFDGPALVGSVGRCGGEPIQPGTRAQVRVEVEIDGVTSRHRFVALVEEVRSAATIWRVQAHGAGLVDAAVRALRADRTAVSVTAGPNWDGDLACACACDAAETLGREACGAAGLAAFTCTPVFFPAGCTQSSTCRR